MTPSLGVCSYEPTFCLCCVDLGFEEEPPVKFHLVWRQAGSSGGTTWFWDSRLDPVLELCLIALWEFSCGIFEQFTCDDFVAIFYRVIFLGHMDQLLHRFNYWDWDTAPTIRVHTFHVTWVFVLYLKVSSWWHFPDDIYTQVISDI